MRAGLQAFEPCAEPQVHAVVTMHRSEDSPHERSDRSFEWDREGLDDDHVGSKSSRSRRHLEADESRPGNDQTSRRPRDDLAQGDGVLEIAQGEHPGPSGEARERPRLRPGRDHQSVEFEAAAIAKSDRSPRHVEVRCPRSEMKLDPKRIEVPRRPEDASVSVPGAREELLGKRRAIVRQGVLRADPRQRSVEAMLAKDLASAQAREAPADNHYGPEPVDHKGETTGARLIRPDRCQVVSPGSLASVTDATTAQTDRSPWPTASPELDAVFAQIVGTEEGRR